MKLALLGSPQIESCRRSATFPRTCLINVLSVPIFSFAEVKPVQLSPQIEYCAAEQGCYCGAW